MEDNRILYLIAAIGVASAVTYILRALPFIVFARKKRELPAWVNKLGVIISPVIITVLTVYSYTTLEWRTAAPYIAGVLTVVFQIFWRNPLVSIIAGTALYMTLVRI